jgi:hypothetical protein
MIALDTLRALHEHDHKLAAYCPVCSRWKVRDLAALIAQGRGDDCVVGRKPRCRYCGAPGVWRRRAPAMRPGCGAVAYIFELRLNECVYEAMLQASSAESREWEAQAMAISTACVIDGVFGRDVLRSWGATANPSSPGVDTPKTTDHPYFTLRRCDRSRYGLIGGVAASIESRNCTSRARSAPEVSVSTPPVPEARCVTFSMTSSREVATPLWKNVCGNA